MIEQQTFHSEHYGDILKANGKCPVCDREMLQLISDEKQVLKSAVTFITNGQVKGKCKWCKQVITIPIAMLKGMQVPVRLFGKRYTMKVDKK